MDRDIFKYQNGERDVYGDPLVLRDRLFTVSMGEYWNLRRKMQAMGAELHKAEPDNTVIMEGIAARGHVVNIVRDTFGMVEYDDATGKGATADECLATVQAFVKFCDQKKTSSAPPQTTLPPTASIPQPQTPANTPTMSASS